MTRRKGPDFSAEAQKLKRELDAARSDLNRMKRNMASKEAQPTGAPPPEATETAADNAALRGRVVELEEARERLGRLYATQLEENRKRAQKLQHILRVVSDINSDLDRPPCSRGSPRPSSGSSGSGSS